MGLGAALLGLWARERSLSGAIGGMGAARCWLCSGLVLLELWRQPCRAAGCAVRGLQGAGDMGHPVP